MKNVERFGFIHTRSMCAPARREESERRQLLKAGHVEVAARPLQPNACQGDGHSGMCVRSIVTSGCAC